jgi:hypothetical protein
MVSSLRIIAIKIIAIILSPICHSVKVIVCGEGHFALSVRGERAAVAAAYDPRMAGGSKAAMAAMTSLAMRASSSRFSSPGRRARV